MYPWQKNVRKVDPYVPGEQPKTLDVTKLNTNENPYPPAPGVAEALRRWTPICFGVIRTRMRRFWWMRWRRRIM